MANAATDRIRNFIKKGVYSMEALQKCIAGLLVLTVMGLCYPKSAFCGGALPSAKVNAKAITRHEPRIKSEPAKDISLAPGETGGQKKTAKWLLYGLGAALVVGLAMGAGGGSSSDGGTPDNNSPAGDGSGTVSVGW
jgi:hypothetical protein